MRFLLVDRILQLEPGREAVVRKNVSNSEDFFSDHFAGRPVMPGCLILEACDQAARLLLASGSDFTKLPMLEGVANGKFQHLVQPGDSLEIQAALTTATAERADVRAVASVEGRRVAQASLTYTLRPREADPAVTRACARMRAFYEMLIADPTQAAGEGGVPGVADREGHRA